MLQARGIRSWLILRRAQIHSNEATFICCGESVALAGSSRQAPQYVRFDTPSERDTAGSKEP